MGRSQPHYACAVSEAPVPPKLLGAESGTGSFDREALRSVVQTGRRRRTPLFVIDSHPVDICRTKRAEVEDVRLEGLGKIGYCAGTARWFCGVREHLIFTPHGMVTSVTQVPGNRHDVQGLYTLLRTTFHGLLFSDNAYTPGAKLDAQLRAREIVVIAQPRKNSRQPLPRRTRIFVHAKRSHVERRISLFDKQFNAGRT